MGYVECAQDVWLEADDTLEWPEESANGCRARRSSTVGAPAEHCPRCQLAKDVTDPSTERSRTWTLVWSKDRWICS